MGKQYGNNKNQKNHSYSKLNVRSVHTNEHTAREGGGKGKTFGTKLFNFHGLRAFVSENFRLLITDLGLNTSPVLVLIKIMTVTVYIYILHLHPR